MRFQLLMVPAALVASAPALAADFLTLEQAQAALFPGATFTQADFVLTEPQIDELLRTTNAPVFRAKVRAWKVSTGGWFVLDQVIGRDDRITYAIGLDTEGGVKGIEVLTCLPEYGGIRNAGWLGQFTGKRDGVGDLSTQISTISGTTLSVNHVIEGVKRTLATFAKYVAPKAG